MNQFKTTSLADQVFEKLENDIIQGVYPRGEILTELKLVDQLGVSRTPIREALRRLEQERLIEDTGKGSRVVGITEEDLEDIMNIRQRIEGLAAYYATKNMTPEGLAQLTHIADLQDFYFDKGDAELLRQVDEQFHDTICYLSKRTVIVDTLLPCTGRPGATDASPWRTGRAPSTPGRNTGQFWTPWLPATPTLRRASWQSISKTRKSTCWEDSKIMGKTIAQKIIASHLVSGDMTPGSEVALRIDQTLTQDATGTMAYLEFETMGIPRVKTEMSIAYVDHNTLQCGFENSDDHRYLQTVTAKHGVYFSRPGNGICHQVHLERFGKPGKTLIGSDSHTPTGGGIGMLAFGAGGLDVAVAMGGGAYYITMPKMYKVNLTGKLRPYVTAKDVSLELLRILSVKGGVGAIIEWGGEGIATLSVPERGTITNMGTELGATTSIFPSDEVTRKFLAAQGREEDYVPLSSDPDAEYDKIIDIDLGTLKPMIACPHSPDNVVAVETLKDVKVDQVCIGSCTNSSLYDMLKVAAMLKGKTIHPSVSLSVSPGSRQVLTMLSDCCALSDILASGARVLECACGPCIGMGFSPNSGGVSLRTFNRNFLGRSGTRDGQVYLVSPETAVASALTGYITDPTTIDQPLHVTMPEKFLVNDSAVLPPLPADKAADAEVLRGPNIKEFPKSKPFADSLTAKLVLKVGDNITTDHIMPAGAKILPYRSNIPYLSKFCFEVCDPTFAERAKAAGDGIVVGGSNYGQGSSREHAALVPMYLGIRCVIAKSFARIHVANLINAGILPVTFENPEDYDKLNQDAVLTISDIASGMEQGRLAVTADDGFKFYVNCALTERQRAILMAGGLLNYTKEGGQ